ncbi:flavin reductase family protein [Streptomyces sp. NBC_00249]|uniref:flavin reductase family protein n=1 Tax=Streptomyces sp. NBC_00249 TaxID=2975690 RepID=UPI00225807FF|nr:flavin reductase family protein [Streptomyces sp. NBC_00249]MCX5196715.1 flavin reductase family protein [Streptomyces sp. NBC_00249]
MSTLSTRPAAGPDVDVKPDVDAGGKADADMKSVLSSFCTGVAVVTACGSDGRPVAMAVQSFSSVSLDPPLVCFCPARTSTSWPGIRAAGAFAVNILAADQEGLCRRFAVTGGDKFAGVPWRAGGNGAPLLDGVLATVECTLEDVLDGGDHAIVLGRVTALAAHREGAPLLYFRRTYGRLPRSGAPEPSAPGGTAIPSRSESMAAARSRSEA